jgi:hypothetical protein
LADQLPSTGTTTQDGSENRSFADGEGLAVRLDGAHKLLDDERDREQSLNTRALAVAAAAAVLMGLLQRPIVTAFELHVPDVAHLALAASGVASVVCATGVVLLAVLGVLRPMAREGLTSEAMDRWLEDEGMAEAEQTARYELLDAAVKATASRRAVNERKATALAWGYGFLLAEVLAAAPVLVTLALR